MNALPHMEQLLLIAKRKTVALHRTRQSPRRNMVSVATVTVQQMARSVPAKDVASCSGRKTYHDDMAKILYTETAINLRVVELGR